MSKTRDTGYLANVIQVHDTGVRIMSGSTMLMAISSSGAVTITGEMSGSDAANALLLDGTGSLSFTTTASYNAFSASYAIASASLSSRTTQVERTYATTGSNTFTGAQYVSDTSNGIGFTSTASFYTDGGLRVGKNAYVSGTAYFNNIVVFGTSSIQYITSSQVNIGANIITVNTDTPAVRFGGLSVFDSGSTQLTGSIFWDSEKNHWVYSNPSGSTYSGGMLISGPRSSALGCEQGTTSCMLLVGQGSDHLTSSMIYHSSTVTCIPNTLIGASDLILSATNGNIYGGTASGSAIISNIGGQTYARFYGASHATTPNVTAFVNAGSTTLTISNTGDTCFASNACALNLISRCNIRVGVNGGYAVISGPTTGAAISLGSNSATFDRNLSLGLMAGDFTFSPVLTINAQTSNVGILNCTPDRRLYVADTSVTQGTFLAYNQCTTFCGTVIEAITDRTSNCAFNLMNLKASTTSMFLVRGDGKVGIGTASPAELLEIAGSLKIGNLKIENVNGGSIGFNRNTSNGAIYNCCYAAFQINGALSGTNYLDFQNYSSSGSYLGSFVFKDGCMGIGTTNPTGTYGKLTVAGGISILDNNTAKLEIGRYSSGAPNSYIKIGTNSNSLRITNAADSVDLVSIENSGIATFACNICVAKYLTVGSQGGGDIVFLGGGSGVGAAIEARYADGNPNVRLAGNGNSWINRTYGNVGIGTCTPNYLLDVNGVINSSAGVIYSNSVGIYTVGGTMQGTTATYFDFPAWNDAGQGQMFEIKAFFDHFYNWAYGAHYYVYLTTRDTLSQALTMFSCPTGNGGSWMAYKPNTTTLRVCKIAGTYVGGGAYWIQVTAKQP